MCVDISQIDIEPQRVTDLPLNATVVHRVLLDKWTLRFVGTGGGTSTAIHHYYVGREKEHVTAKCC